VVVGAGEQLYEVWHDWLTPPEGLLWGETHGVAQDSEGRIYIAHTVHPDSVRKESIVVFDDKGRFITAWGDQFAGGLHGLSLRNEDGTEFLYHCDTIRNEFTKTTLDGVVVWTKGYPYEAPPYAKAERINWSCTNIAFHPDGGFYVADGYGSSYILAYDRNGNFTQVIGVPGSLDGQLFESHGLWVDTRHSPAKLVVADRGNSRLQIFSLDGRHELTVKLPGIIRMPCNFHVRGDLMVCPDLESAVHLLDIDYNVITSLGEGRNDGQVERWPLRLESREKFIEGEFITPHDAMILANGDLLVTEWVPIGRVTLLKKLT
jgi:hypothetical protein